MKTTKTFLFTSLLISVAPFAFARGFGDRSNDTARNSYGGPAASVRQDTPRASSPAGQDMSGVRSSGMPRGDSAPVRAAPSQSFTPRSTPSPAPTYTPPARSASGSPAGGTIRETPAPQVRTYTAPRSVNDNGGAGFGARTTESPRTAGFTGTTRRDDNARTTESPRTAGFTGTTRRDDNARSTVQATAPLVINDNNARNSGTPRGAFSTRQETITPVTPTVTRQTAEPRRMPAVTPIDRTQPRITERSQATPHAPFSSVQPRSSAPSTAIVPPANSVRSGSRTPSDTTPFSRSSTHASAPAASAQSQAHNADAAAHGQTSHTPFQHITAPDTRLVSPTSTRGTASLRFGSAGDNTRTRTTRQPLFGMTPRSTPHSADESRGGRTAVAGPIPSSLTGRNTFSSSSERSRQTSSRYSDGRSSVYRAPDRYASMGPRADYRGRPDYHDYHGGNHPPQPYHYNPYAFRYDHHAFSPIWYGPVTYPAGNSFGFSWCNGSFGLSFASYSPYYAYSTRYYDSWSCGGWGYSSVYYGGWHNNWYGGFSYVYNPWPVYRTYYLYDPEPIVIPAETVYVTQPATTTYVVQNTAAAPVVQQPAAVVTEPQQTQTVWDAAPAVDRAETVATSCFCPCHCNGQRPCICAYPCGSEYAVLADPFDLSLTYSPYAETLNPETIWSSYAGLDRENSYTDPNLYDATVSTGIDPR